MVVLKFSPYNSENLFQKEKSIMQSQCQWYPNDFEFIKSLICVYTQSSNKTLKQKNPTIKH